MAFGSILDEGADAHNRKKWDKGILGGGHSEERYGKSASIRATYELTGVKVICHVSTCEVRSGEMVERWRNGSRWD